MANSMRKSVLITGVFLIIIGIFFMTIFPNLAAKYISESYPYNKSFAFEIQPLKRYYIPLSLHSGDNVYVDMEIRGEIKDINFYIVSPSGNYVKAPSRVYSYYTYSFTATGEGTYYLWFDNSFSILTPKHVSVELTLKSEGLALTIGSRYSSLAGFLFLIVGVVLIAIGAYLKPETKK